MDIKIEYCAAWDYEPQAVGLTEELLESYKLKVSSLELEPFDDGRFEVFLDGEKVFSKLDVDRFPEHEEITQEVESRL